MPFPFPDVSNRSISQLLSLSGRGALVTGGAQGLGRAIATRLAEAGADVAIADLHAEPAAAAARELGDRFGVRAVGVQMDVSDEASVASAAAEAVGSLGGLGIWVNNAGLFPNVSALDMTIQEWDHVFAVNTRGTFIGSREAARQMGPSGGVIINIASTAAFSAPAAGLAAYVSSKHATRGMTKSLALEFAPLGIRVLGIAPSYVPTEGNAAMLAELTEQATAAGVEITVMDAINHRLIGRLGTPDDIARVALFAASDMATFMTGTVLLADAGETI